MNLPFTQTQFVETVLNYNQAVWPVQAALAILAVFVIYLLLRPSKRSPQTILGALALLWLWMAVGYHWFYFSAINPAAKWFALIFALQAVILFYYARRAKHTTFSLKPSGSAYAGAFLIFLGLTVYPLWGYLVGHIYPNTPTFGLPCPTTIFTLGVLLLGLRLPKRLLIIPILWSLLGFTAALSLGITEDSLLLLAGLISLVVVIGKRK